MNIALITAGGKGTRFNDQIPKQFLEINGKPLIIYTLEKFQNNTNIDYIIVSCLKGWDKRLVEWKEKYNISKLKWITQNGSTQPESIRNCINVLKNNISEEDIVIIHVANRPLITDDIINNSIKVCKSLGNAVTSVQCPEVLITRDTNRIINRNNILKIQTPQTFKMNDLIDVYCNSNITKIDNVATTCDLMIKLNRKVNFIEGSHLNIKITYPEDIIMFESLLESSKNKIR